MGSLPSWSEFAQPDTTYRNELDEAADTLAIEEAIVDSSTNEIAVAFGQAGGTFAIQTAQDATVTLPEGWSLFDHAAVGDFDGDGNDDIVWNRLDSENSFYVALSNGDGSFTWGERQQHALPGWSIYEVHAVDVDNTNGDDLVWNGHTSSINRTYVALSLGEGTFDLEGATAQDQIGTCCWAGTDFMIGDVTGDGFADLVHSRTLDADNANWVSIGRGDGPSTCRTGRSRSTRARVGPTTSH